MPPVLLLIGIDTWPSGGRCGGGAFGIIRILPSALVLPIGRVRVISRRVFFIRMHGFATGVVRWLVMGSMGVSVSLGGSCGKRSGRRRRGGGGCCGGGAGGGGFAGTIRLDRVP